jgi:hypothetical protein
MNPFILAAWLTTVQCGHIPPTTLSVLEDQQLAMRLASRTFDDLSNASKLQCEINVKEIVKETGL